DIGAEISVSDELETVVSLRLHQRRLHIGGNCSKGIGIHVKGAVLFIVNSFFLIHDVLIQADCRLPCISGFHPVDRAFYLTSVRGVSSLGLRIIGTVHYPYGAVVVGFKSRKGTKISINNTELHTREKSFIFLWRIAI